MHSTNIFAGKQKEADCVRLFVYSPEPALRLRQPAVHGHFGAVMNEASADARNATAPAISDGWPIRFIGTLATTSRTNWSICSFGKPVRAKPPASQSGPGSLHLRESSLANSAAATRDERRADFVAAYTERSPSRFRSPPTY